MIQNGEPKQYSGITPEMEEQVRREIREAKRRKHLEASQRQASITTPEPPVSDAVKARVKLASSELEKARFLQRAAMGGSRPMDGSRRIPPKVRAKIREHESRAKRLLTEAEGITKSEAEAAWLEGALAETVGLALLRGEHVAEQPVAGTKTKRRWMVSRGQGLEHARDSGYLAGAHGRDETDELYRVGQTYRDAYELIDGKASKRGDVSGGPAAFGPKGPQVAVIEAGDRLRVMREGLNAKQRRVLDLVCGEGLGLYQVAKAAGLGAPSVRNALRGGLGVALEGLRKAAKARKAGEGSTVAADVRAASSAVSEAGRGL